MARWRMAAARGMYGSERKGIDLDCVRGAMRVPSRQAMQDKADASCSDFQDHSSNARLLGIQQQRAFSLTTPDLAEEFVHTSPHAEVDFLRRDPSFRSSSRLPSKQLDQRSCENLYGSRRVYRF